MLIRTRGRDGAPLAGHGVTFPCHHNKSSNEMRLHGLSMGFNENPSVCGKIPSSHNHSDLGCVL